MLLLQKGDLYGASLEFSTLASKYSEHQALIAKMANRLRNVRIPAAGIVKALRCCATLSDAAPPKRL